MRIDVHHHILPPFYTEALREAGLDRSLGIRFPEWRPEDSLDVMDRTGIDTALVSVSAPGVAFGGRALARRCNEWAAELVDAHPGRFGAFASVPLPDVDGALEETAYALDSLRLDGVVLLSSAGGRYPSDPALGPLLEELDRRRAVVFLHPTVPPAVPPGLDDVPVFTVEFVADTTRAVAGLILSGTLERRPGIEWICAHGGGFAPYITDRLQAAWERDPAVGDRAPAGPLAYLRRLHFDTALSANPFTLAALLALAGPERVLLGTDYPFADRAQATIDALGAALPPDDAGAVLGRNAARLLGAGRQGRF